MKRYLIPLLVLLFGLLAPQRASAQIDAIIDAVVDAVEPTPVYDTGLREATENLASKIDRLNHVLFGGAEETSAAYRYRTMYSDLYDLTTAFSSFVDRSFSNAKRLEKVYTDLDGGTLSDHARAVQTTWYTYDNTIRTGSRIVAQFKKLFGDSNTTNAEVRQAAREAIAELQREQAEEDRRINAEIAATEVAAGLVECSQMLDPSPQAYIEEGKKTYGTSISSGGSSASTGTLGTAVMIIVGLLCVVYGAFAGFHIMKGSRNAESLLTRLIVFIVISLVIILAIQSHI
ncbi:MAG: hypothetical protein IJ230_02925 [Clostridia bacterium]|nr:hypothetical protein [Clostridia bacterium]